MDIFNKFLNENEPIKQSENIHISTDDKISETNINKSINENDGLKQDGNKSIIPTTYEQGLDFVAMQGLAHVLKDSEKLEELAIKSSDIVDSKIEVEKSKMQNKQVEEQLERMRKETQAKREVNQQSKESYSQKLDNQEYWYRSFKPFLECLFIYEPFNVIAMGLTAFTIGIFMFSITLLFKMTFGNLFKAIKWLFSKSQERKEYKERLEPIKEIKVK